MKDLRKTEDLTPQDFQAIVDLALEYGKNPLRDQKFFAHQTVGIYMNKPSTRTRLASSTAVANLGGVPILLRSDELQLGRGETISDTSKIMNCFLKALIIRTYAQSDVDELASASSLPVINGLTDDDHPTQVLADWAVIKEEFGENYKEGKYVYLGDGNNVAHAWLIAGALMGVEVVIATPPGKYQLKAESLDIAKRIAKETGAKVSYSNDPIASATNARVLYTDVWLSMGDDPATKAEKFAALAPFAVDQKLISLMREDGIFLHCLPAHRGEEVSAEVIDGPRSRVWREAFHRRTTIQAALYLLTQNLLTGN